MICYDDSYLLVVNKPNNTLVHHSRMAKNQQNQTSLIQHLYEIYQLPFYPIHRLDRKTSGLVMFAKEKRWIQPFQDLFVHQEITKTYYGLVRGFTPKTGCINSPVKGRDALVYKDAETHYTTLKQFELPIAVGPYTTSRYSLLQLTPTTGRLHQLRIHLNKISHPLLGDPKYGDRFHNRMFENKLKNDQLFLHAYQLEFIHPFTKKNQLITADFGTHWHLANAQLFNNELIR